VALGSSFLRLKEATGFLLLPGQLKRPRCALLASLHISVISKPEKVTETQEKPTSLLHWNSSFCLAHAFVAISCLPNAGTNTGVWQGSEPWLVRWESGILGPQPGDRALLHVHCQLLQLQFCCPAHAESTVLTCLGTGSTPGCWAVNPAGDPWKVGGNSWSRTQSYVNPSMLLWLSCTYSGKRRSQHCLQRLFPKYA